MKKSNATVGLYLHLPFCLRKCLYCDFCSFPNQTPDTVHRYVTRLCDELVARAPSVHERPVDTVYFGGGTPTLLPAGEFDRLLDTIHRHYAVSEDAEITTECNPATADRQKLTALRSLGVNRLSIGAQSAVEEELRALGRVHTFDQARQTVEDARAAGFDNLSLDLMYGIPHQTVKSFERTLREVLSLSPEHISAYSLIVEPGTPFYERQNTLALADEDTVCDMTALCLAMLRERGYERYEISNFARAGFASRHNERYWTLDDYLGFGIAAHSLLSLSPASGDGTVARRTQNGTDLSAYLAGKPVSEPEEELTLAQLRDESVMLGLRLTAGIDKRAFAERFGQEFDQVYGPSAAPFVRMGLLHDTPERIAFTDDGFAVSNSVLSEMLFD